MHLSPRPRARLSLASFGLALSASLGLAGLGCDQAKDKAKDLGDTVKGSAQAIGDTAREAGGDLSERARGQLASTSASDAGEAARLVGRGHQVLATAAEIHRTVSGAIDQETTIEPIYQRIDDEEDVRATDAAIAKMPRVEPVDGLTVGFQDLREISATTHRQERGFLVLWRRDDRRVGFLYHTRREIDLVQLIAEAPRLVRLVDATARATPEATGAAAGDR